MAYNYEYPYVDATQANADWLINEMRRVATEWAETKNEWSTVKEELENLKQYLLDYFNNLNVQDEINNKIDELVQNGTLANILAPYIWPSYMPIIVTNVAEMVNKSKLYVLKGQQHIYQWNGSEWEDTGAIYGLDIVNGLRYGGIVSEDYNNLKPFTIYYQSGRNWIQPNNPQEVVNSNGGWVVTWGVNPPDATSYQNYLQEYINLYTGERLAYRNKSSGSWGEWQKTDRFPLVYKGKISEDYNNLKPFTIYYQPGNNWTYPNNPQEVVNSNGGWVVTWGVNSPEVPTTYNSYLQEYINIYTGDRLAYRNRTSGQWSEWKKIDRFSLVYKGNISKDYNNLEPFTIYYQSGYNWNYDNSPQEIVNSNGGWVFTWGVNSPDSTKAYYSYLQEYINIYTGEKMAYRNFRTGTWSEWQSVVTPNVNIYAKAFFTGNSIMHGDYNTESGTKYASWGSSPYSVIAQALNIPESNTTMEYIGGTGLLYKPHGTNFYEKITAIDNYDKYDVICTMIHFGDMEFPLGDSSSTADTTTIAGAVKSIIQQIGSTQFILIAPPPTQNSTETGYNNFYTHVYRNGKTMADVDSVMLELALSLHFNYLTWKDFNLTYKMPDYEPPNDNHPKDERIYRLIGAHLAGQLKYHF